LSDSSALIALGGLALLLLAAAVVVTNKVSGKRAERRADTLVREHLTPVEMGLLHERGYLDVPSRATPGRVYRIPARPGLVTVIDSGEFSLRLCLHPAHSIPEREHIVVHKLLLEGAEAEYWQRANRLMGQCWRPPDASEVELWIGSAPGVLSCR
jgi:hypothetical protein